MLYAFAPDYTKYIFIFFVKSYALKKIRYNFISLSILVQSSELLLLLNPYLHIYIFT